MKTPYQYNCVYTKCRAMSAALLKPNDYIQLSKMTELKEITNYLSAHAAYEKEFTNVDLSTINRNILEQILNYNMYDTYMTLYIFTSGELQKFIGAMKDKYEVDFIMRCILKLYMESDELIKNHFFINDEKYESLYNASTFQEIFSLLENTQYRGALKNIIIGDTIDINYIETLLYDVYYNRLYNSYKANDRRIMALKVVIENLQRILRLKYNFHLNTDQIYPYLIDLRSFRDTKKLMEIIELPDEQFLKTIAKYLKIKEIPENLEEFISAIYISNFMYRNIKKIFLNTKPSFGTPFAYLSLKEYEIKNLVHIIEGVRYNIPSDTILKYIVGLED